MMVDNPVTLSQPTSLTCSTFAPLPAQTTDILNTAVLTGKMVSIPVKTLAVEANGSVTDVTNYTSCRSTEDDVVKVSHSNYRPSRPGSEQSLQSFPCCL